MNGRAPSPKRTICGSRMLTMNPQPLHIDAHYSAKSEWGKPLVNSLFTLA